MIDFDERPPKHDGMPLEWHVTIGRDASPDRIGAWLAEQAELCEHRLLAHGSVLVRGFHRLGAAPAFERALAGLPGRLQAYVGGTSPRRVVQGRIMTATEAPGDYSIPLHQEMSYTANPPERIAFVCERPAAEGGETTVADMRTVTRELGSAIAARFVQKGGLQLRRHLPRPEQIDVWPGFPKPWTEVFGTTDPEEADRVARSRGWRTQWEADGSVQLWQEVLPALRTHPVSGDEVWFNQIHIFDPAASVRWARRDGRHAFADRLEAALRSGRDKVDRIVHGDGSELDEADVEHVAEVMDRAARPLAWRTGDLLVMDNILAAHGRRQFSGPRSILAALIGHCHQVQPVPA